MKCQECKYWMQTEDDLNFGHCHRYAAKPLICPANAKAEEWHTRRYVKWPGTNAEEWCGEFEAKEPEIKA